MEENDKTLPTTQRTNEQNEEIEESIETQKSKKPLKDEEIIKLFKSIKIVSDDLLTMAKDLINFSFELNSLKNIGLFLTYENLDILKNLNTNQNIKVLLALSKIYNNLLSNDSLYSSYFLEFNEDKTNIILQTIDESISLIQKLDGFVFDPEIFNFKTKIISIIKCFYYNFKNKITNDVYIQKLYDFLNSVPYEFFSENFNELNKNKELYDVWKSEDKDKINSFEDKFAQINNYYEQLEAFRKFVDCNCGEVTYDSVGGEQTTEKKEEEKKEIDPSKIEFYNQYGLLLLKFCKYHHYIFLNKENNEAKKDEKQKEKVRVAFVLDNIKFDEDKKDDEKNEEKNEEKNNEQKEENTDDEGRPKPKKEENEKVQNLMDQKLFSSVTESEEYNKMIKKLLEYYLDKTKSLEEDPKIKSIRNQMTYFLSILDVESYVPLYLKEFGSITISDNFTPSFLTNVPSRSSNNFYLETRKDETMLVFIEFFLEDKTKDITFEVNKYEFSSNTFQPIFKEEKIVDTFKFFILCRGYSLYQIVFNNKYSWFTSKDVNYRIALLKLINKTAKGIITDQKKDEEEEDNKKEEQKKDEDIKEDIVEEKENEEESNEDKFYCKLNGKNICFNHKKINQKIQEFEEKEENKEIINIPVILYLNNLRIVSIKKSENKISEIEFIEHIENDEKFIPKHFFDFTLVKYIKKSLKIKPAESKNKKIIISIFSQNRDLSALYNEVNEQVKALNVSTINNSLNDAETLNYLQKIGFYPSEIIEGYQVEYKLYDLCEQSLIYHLYLTNLNKNPPKKSVLFLEFDKLVVNAAVFNEGAILTKLKGTKEKDSNWKSSYFNNIKADDTNGILDFLENANDTFEGIDLVLSYIDNSEEKKKKVIELFENIKKHCQEKINPPINVFVYEEKEIANNIFNYMNLFYNN